MELLGFCEFESTSLAGIFQACGVREDLCWPVPEGYRHDLRQCACPWEAHSLTEDTELQGRIIYCPKKYSIKCLGLQKRDRRLLHYSDE